MTYIIGARCKDGVALIGDRKITGGSSNSHYDEKIKMAPFFNDAGFGDLFEEILEELPRRVLLIKPSSATPWKKRCLPSR